MIHEDVAQELRRLLVQSGLWTTGPSGTAILTGQPRNVIGEMHSPDRARLVVLMKTYFLPLLNEYTMACRELNDARRQIAELNPLGDEEGD